MKSSILNTSRQDVDVAIIGAGPAGCSCALWLHQFGLCCVLIDRATELCSSLTELEFEQDWVLGFPGSTMSQIGHGYAAHIRHLKDMPLALGQAVRRVQRLPNHHVEIGLADGLVVRARAVVLATGLRPRRPPHYFGSGANDRQVLDARTLTLHRDGFRRLRILILGGGDNAVENAVYLHDRGNHVTLWSRRPLRASEHLRRALHQRAIECRVGEPLPDLATGSGPTLSVTSPDHGSEFYDRLAVLFGYEPQVDVLDRFEPPTSLERLWPNLFVAGDLSLQRHPCVQSALADGVSVAKRVQQWLSDPPRASSPAPAPARVANPQAQGPRVLTLNGLRFAANLGILEHEKLAPQPIQVDAELHMGLQPLLPRDDDIHRVLDYRKVRKIIIDECTAEHTNLLESLIGKLSLRLMQLPGVVGVRVKIAKLEIFADCEVAIRMETGSW